MEVRVGAGDLDRLVPAGRLQAQHRLPVELDELALALGVDEAEGVHAESLDHAQAARDRAVGHRPHHHVQRLRHQADEVPERVVRRGRLRIAAVRLHLHAVDEVRELDRVLDEEYRDVVADQVPVPGVRVELDGKAAHVARRVDRAGAAGHGREAHEHRAAVAFLLEDRGPRQLGYRLRHLEDRRARRSRARGRCARESVRDRSGRSSRAGRSLPAASGPRVPARSEFWLSEIA